MFTKLVPGDTDLERLDELRKTHLLLLARAMMGTWVAMTSIQLMHEGMKLDEVRMAWEQIREDREALCRIVENSPRLEGATQLELEVFCEHYVPAQLAIFTEAMKEIAASPPTGHGEPLEFIDSAKGFGFAP